MKTRGSFALLDSLVRNGTRHIFGYPGGAILPIYDEVYKWEEKNLIKHILVRHEQGVFMLQTVMHAQLVKLEFACDTRAWCDEFNRNRDRSNGFSTFSYDYRQVGRPFIGTDASKSDIFGITLPIVKHSYVIRDVKKIAHIVSEAFFIARNGAQARF